MEFALTQNWSAKAEYMYYDLGSDTFVTRHSPVEDYDAAAISFASA